MKGKKGLIILIMAIMMCIHLPNEAQASINWGTQVTITSSMQVVDSITFNGVTVYSYYAPKSSVSGYDSNTTYSCAAFVKRFYSQVFGVNVSNLYPGYTPYVSSGSFSRTTSPQVGDIAANSGHWAIVKAVSGSTVTLVEQNAWWNDTQACIGRTLTSESSYWFWHWSGNKGNPWGYVDSITGGKGKITVKGWAFDISDLSNQIRVHVYIGGEAGSGAESHEIVANKLRTDVNNVYSCGNYHGFEADISTNLTGTQPVYIYALNVGAGDNNPRIGNGTVTIKTSHSHNWTKSSVTKATTTKDGKIKYTCSCGAKKSTTIYYPKDIKLSKTIYIYDGKEKKPSVTVTGSDGNTIAAKNYTVTYSSGRKKVGTYKVTIKFKGNYSGTSTKTYKIVKSHTHSWKESSVTKASTKKNGVIKKTCSCGETKSSTIYYPKTIKLSKTSYTYDGSEKKPSVTVIGSDGKTISSGNYTVSYSSGRKKPGTYKVTIKFKGNYYTGTVTKKYTIEHTHSYKSTVTRATTEKNGEIKYTCSCGATKSSTIYYPKTVKLSSKTFTYDGSEKKPSVTVIGSDGNTISDGNYTVSYSSGRIQPGTYTVTITFKGNYSGTVTRTYTIEKSHTHNYESTVTKATISKNGEIRYTCSCGSTISSTIYYPKTITLSSTSYTYDGSEKKPSVTVIGSDGNTISAKNYSVSYSSGRIKAGTYTVTITFTGNYSGTVTKSFTIENPWIYVSTLPSGVTSSKYEIQYKNTCQTTTQYYENSGSVYESAKPLTTSDTVVLVGYYYFHFCGPTTGNVVNYEISGGFVHFDSVSADQATVVSSGADGEYTYYLLNWKGTSTRIWCASGTTCDGSYGTHGTRGQAWYRMYQYQNRVLKTTTTTTTSDWTSTKDSSAVKTEYRYRLK